VEKRPTDLWLGMSWWSDGCLLARCDLLGSMFFRMEYVQGMGLNTMATCYLAVALKHLSSSDM